MTDRARTISRSELGRTLRRAGLPEDHIRRILRDMPDPVDIDREDVILSGYGVTREHLEELMGGGP